MNTTRLTTSGEKCTTYRGDKQNQQGQELNDKYEHKVNRRISQNDVEEARYSRMCIRPHSLGSDNDDREREDIYRVTTRGSMR